jgi:hypothetical protein
LWCTGCGVTETASATVDEPKVADPPLLRYTVTVTDVELQPRQRAVAVAPAGVTVHEVGFTDQAYVEPAGAEPVTAKA